MRLGQLARKLNLRQSEIVSFLAAHNNSIEEGSNARLEEAQVKLVLANYAPSMTNEVLNESDQPQDEIQEAGPDAETSATPQPQTQAGPETEKPEIIRAPKVELSGLKVLGKIEIKTSAKKEKPAKPADGPERDSHDVRRDKPRREKPRINPIAAKRQQEAAEQERKRREEEVRKKEKRTKHYFSKVKTHVPTKPARIVDEPVEVTSTTEAPPPRTLVGRFFRWLRK